MGPKPRCYASHDLGPKAQTHLTGFRFSEHGSFAQTDESAAHSRRGSSPLRKASLAPLASRVTTIKFPESVEERDTIVAKLLEQVLA